MLRHDRLDLRATREHMNLFCGESRGGECADPWAGGQMPNNGAVDHRLHLRVCPFTCTNAGSTFPGMILGTVGTSNVKRRGGLGIPEGSHGAGILRRTADLRAVEGMTAAISVPHDAGRSNLCARLWQKLPPGQVAVGNGSVEQKARTGRFRRTENPDAWGACAVEQCCLC